MRCHYVGGRRSHWRPEPGPLARQLAGLYCPCGAVRGGNAVCGPCYKAAPEEARMMAKDQRTKVAGLKALLAFAGQRGQSLRASVARQGKGLA